MNWELNPFSYPVTAQSWVFFGGFVVCVLFTALLAFLRLVAPIGGGERALGRLHYLRRIDENYPVGALSWTAFFLYAVSEFWMGVLVCVQPRWFPYHGTVLWFALVAALLLVGYYAKLFQHGWRFRKVPLWGLLLGPIFVVTDVSLFLLMAYGGRKLLVSYSSWFALLVGPVMLALSAVITVFLVEGLTWAVEFRRRRVRVFLDRLGVGRPGVSSELHSDYVASVLGLR